MKSSVKRDCFITCFLISMYFISFSCPIALSRTSSFILSRCGESGHPYLVPDIRGNAFSLSSLNIMLDVDLSYLAFIMLRYSLSIPSLLTAFIIMNDC